MAPLILDLNSPTVDLVLQWLKDGALPGFDLLGRVDEGVARWSQDLVKKQMLSRIDFGDHGMELDLSDWEVDSDRATQLAKALQGDVALTGLHLTRSCLGDGGVGILTKAIAKASVLEVLVLSKNGLSAKACAGLATVLERSTALKSLDLRDNSIGSAGVATLSNALRANDFLTDLDLSCNGITDEGAECLAAAVEANPHALTLLDLSGNRLSEGGAEMLAAVFDSSRVLGRLHLSNGPARPCWPLEADKSQPFTVRCSPNDVRITPGRRTYWEPAVGRPEPSPSEPAGQPELPELGGSGRENSGLPMDAEVRYEQEEDELDVSFRAETIRECDRAVTSVVITAQRLTVQVKGSLLFDAELYSLVEPSESSWTMRDGVLEVYLVKAREGEEWPRLTRE